MTTDDYWKECISLAAEETGLVLTDDQLHDLALSAQMGHENYGMAFYSPPASDRLNDIESEWRRKYAELQGEFDAYRSNAEGAVRRALGIYSDTPISIHEYGEVQTHGGRTERVQ